MQFHRVNNKEHQHSLVVSTFLHMHMRQNSMCSSFEGFLYLFWTWTCSYLWVEAAHGLSSFPHPFLPLFIQCDGCLFPFPMWGLMAELPGFASHGRSLHLGAGCQYWKLLDVSGTQPPLSDAVVNLLFWGLFLL